MYIAEKQEQLLARELTSRQVYIKGNATCQLRAAEGECLKIPTSTGDVRIRNKTFFIPDPMIWHSLLNELHVCLFQFRKTVNIIKILTCTQP